MQEVIINKDDILGRECKHICYSVDQEKQNDFVLIKEVIHTKDKRQIHNLVMRTNMKRPVYITKKEFRNHRDKKTWEEMDRVQRYDTTDLNMCNTIQMALGASFPNPSRRIKDVCKSPYVYWADLTLPTYLRYKYQKKYPNVSSFNRLAIFDIETNEYEGTKEAMITSFICEDEIHISYPEYFAKRIDPVDHERIVTETCRRLISKVPFISKEDKNKIEYKDLIKDYKFKFHVYPSAGAGIAAMFHDLHRMLPDFLVAWNISFDMTKLIEILKKDKIPLEDVLCHPDVPKQFRNVRWVPDQASKKTESKKLTKSPAEQWHRLYTQASWYLVDAMSVFKKLRTHEGNRPNYKLSTTLKTEVGVGKLDIPGLDYEDNLDWHIKAQKDFPAEYVAYNVMDNLLIKLLDDKNKDLASAISVLSQTSQYDIFPSIPKRICDAFTFFLLEHNKVIGSVGADIRDDFDDEIISTVGWIVTLQGAMNSEEGLRCLKGMPEITTAFRGQTADADLTQAYPSATISTNQGRETVAIELIDIEGVPEEARRRCGINLTSGYVNAIEIANDMFLLPDINIVYDEWKKLYKNEEETVNG